jgi:hypothetical protein
VRIGTAIDTVIVEVLPGDKVAIVCELPLASSRSRESVTHLHGAPSLAHAVPGMAINTGDSADALARPRRPTARASRRVPLSGMRRDSAWAIGYSALAIAGGDSSRRSVVSFGEKRAVVDSELP